MEPVMVVSFTAIAFAAQFVVAVADGVPNINYEQGCRASAAADASLGIVIDDQSINACTAQEKDARDKLVQQWSQFPSNDREHCEREAALGQMPSYVELQTCLQIARETKTLPELQSFIKKRTSSKGR
jgi:hypothetical protein